MEHGVTAFECRQQMDNARSHYVRLLSAKAEDVTSTSQTDGGALEGDELKQRSRAGDLLGRKRTQHKVKADGLRGIVISFKMHHDTVNWPGKTKVYSIADPRFR